MPGNAPEELRERIDELEATVRGLTQELVEANERIRLLEEEVEGDAGPETANRAMSAEDGETDERDEAEAAADAEDAEGTEEDDDDGVEDDIIVA